jgi:hypothetical protein
LLGDTLGSRILRFSSLQALVKAVRLSGGSIWENQLSERLLCLCSKVGFSVAITALASPCRPVLVLKRGNPFGVRAGQKGHCPAILDVDGSKLRLATVDCVLGVAECAINGIALGRVVVAPPRRPDVLI